MTDGLAGKLPVAVERGMWYADNADQRPDIPDGQTPLQVGDRGARVGHAAFEIRVHLAWPIIWRAPRPHKIAQNMINSFGISGRGPSHGPGHSVTRQPAVSDRD